MIDYKKDTNDTSNKIKDTPGSSMISNFLIKCELFLIPYLPAYIKLTHSNHCTVQPHYIIQVYKAVEIIFNEKFTNYEKGLARLGLEYL